MKIIFLDIDGVLNGHEQNAAGYCGFKPECVAALNLILEAVPEAQLVISSAWRYMMLPNLKDGTEPAMTLKGFEYLLLVAGVNCKGRVRGHTCSDETIKSRGRQILAWLATNFTGRDYLVIDDMEWDFKACGLDPVLETDPGTGLTPDLARKAIKLLQR